MHPAPSIIVFTVLSGLGFGGLFWLAFARPDLTGMAAFWPFAAAAACAVAGLVSSSFHLGHPERALLAFTQWRSSWLSREACLAVAALVLLALVGAMRVFLGQPAMILGWGAAALSLATVGATAMIYAQLKTIPRWHHWSTPLLFVGYALTGGALFAGFGSVAAPVFLLLGMLQLWIWQDGDKRLARSGTTLESGTRLNGRVRAFEPPHTGTNYLLDEMVHVVGRKHAMKLRIIAFVLFAALPWAILVILPAGAVATTLALVVHLSGVLVARWLFFSEAEHVVGLYYGKR